MIYLLTLIYVVIEDKISLNIVFGFFKGHSFKRKALMANQPLRKGCYVL